jgi:hypothetical protein
MCLRPCPLPLRPPPSTASSTKAGAGGGPHVPIGSGPATLCTTKADDGNYTPCQSVGHLLGGWANGIPSCPPAKSQQSPPKLAPRRLASLARYSPLPPPPPSPTRPAEQANGTTADSESRRSPREIRFRVLFVRLSYCLLSGSLVGHGFAGW